MGHKIFQKGNEWKWQYKTAALRGYSNISAKKEIYSNQCYYQETRQAPHKHAKHESQGYRKAKTTKPKINLKIWNRRIYKTETRKIHKMNKSKKYFFKKNNKIGT